MSKLQKQKIGSVHVRVHLVFHCLKAKLKQNTCNDQMSFCFNLAFKQCAASEAASYAASAAASSAASCAASCARPARSSPRPSPSCRPKSSPERSQPPEHPFTGLMKFHFTSYQYLSEIVLDKIILSFHAGPYISFPNRSEIIFAFLNKRKKARFNSARFFRLDRSDFCKKVERP